MKFAILVSDENLLCLKFGEDLLKDQFSRSIFWKVTEYCFPFPRKYVCECEHVLALPNRVFQTFTNADECAFITALCAINEMSVMRQRFPNQGSNHWLESVSDICQELFSSNKLIEKIEAFVDSELQEIIAKQQIDSRDMAKRLIVIPLVCKLLLPVYCDIHATIKDSSDLHDIDWKTACFKMTRDLLLASPEYRDVMTFLTDNIEKELSTTSAVFDVQTWMPMLFTKNFVNIDLCSADILRYCVSICNTYDVADKFKTVWEREIVVTK